MTDVHMLSHMGSGKTRNHTIISQKETLDDKFWLEAGHRYNSLLQILYVEADFTVL